MLKLIFPIFLFCIVLTETSNVNYEEKYSDEKLLVRKISTGFLRGRKMITPKKTEGFIYLSIPIAEPPTGKLRFKAPIPRKKWNGIFNATDYTVSCYWNSQRTSFAPNEFKMNEDCIFANVFTNKNCLIKGGCAVITYVHGGSFHFGTPLQYQPESLVDNFNNASRNVIFVSLGYRQAFLGVSNFNHKLNLSTDLNAGFHDLIHGIKWVKNEIHEFGGDPNRLTVMGDSGGASNTRVLAMSPLTKHLINQIVLCSVASDYVFVRDKNQNASRITAKIAGCADFFPNSSKWDNLEIVENVIACLRSKSAKELSDTQEIIEGMGYQFRFIAKDSGKNAIAPRSYEEMLNETLPIPILSGTVAKEFLYSKHTIIKFPNGTLGINQTELKIWAKRSIENFHYLNPKPTTLAATVKEYNSIPKSAYIFDDVEQYVPTYNYAVNQVLRGSDVYLYEYIYQDVGGAFDTGPEEIYKIPRYLSPKHAQELSYLVGLHVGNFTPKDHQIRFLYSQIFIDFINYGTPKSPTRNWKKFNPKKGNYFVIDFPDPYLKAPGNKNGYHSEAVKFWNTILPRLEGPKTTILSESQISYDPYIEKSMIKRSVPNLNENVKPVFLSLPEEQRTLFFNLAMILWILFIIIGILVFIQIFMFLKLAFKRKDYTKV